MNGTDFKPNAVSLLCSRNPLVQWVWEQGWLIASLPELARGLGYAIHEANIPLMRLRLTLRTLHPQLAGLSYVWLRADDTIEEIWPPLSILQEQTFLNSPYALLYEGAGAVRRRLDVPDATLDFPILEGFARKERPTTWPCRSCSPTVASMRSPSPLIARAASPRQSCNAWPK